MKNKTVKEWTQELAAQDGKYGGGSAASVVGAFATNLAQYVFEVQDGKKKYQGQEEAIKKSVQKAKTLSEELLDLAESDADAFEPVLDLFNLPQETEAEKKYRREKIDQGLADATKPPLNIIKKMGDVMDLFETLITLEVRGSIVEDIAVGLIFIQASIESAKLNCAINIQSIKDKELKDQLTQESENTFHAAMERSRQLKDTAMKIMNHN